MKAECNCSDTEPGLLQISSIYCLHEMTKTLISQRNIEAVDVQERKTFKSNERHTSITSDQLSERWNIGMKQAQQTLRVTTQRGVRTAILPLSRRYRTDRMFNQKKLRNQKFYTDTLFGRCKSISSNTCAQIFANNSYFVKAYPMDQKSMAGQALRQFVRDYRVPEQLTSDGASEQTGPKTEFMQISRLVRKYGIEHHVSKPHRPQQNRAEAVIREVKRRWFRQMTKRRVPKRLWDYSIVWVCETMPLTANSSFQLKGRTPLELVTGETPDISEYLDFSFYDWIWYRDNPGLVTICLDVGWAYHTILFVNRAPVVWYSKRQNTVGTSTFGSKFVAMRISVEIVEALRYKLRMYGMPIARRANQCLL